MRIGIYNRVLKNEKQQAFVANLMKIASAKGITAICHEGLHKQCKSLNIPVQEEFFNEETIASFELDYLLSIGGDGTMLDTLTLVKDSGLPVLGVNMGRFGFLASTQTSEIEQALQELEQKAYTVDQRTVLQLESNGEVFEDFPYALNDFVIHKKDSSSMITVHTYLNGVFLNSYWADGLIIATPTGSSGYSLSCGGPLTFPGSPCFVLTPVAPHNLNVRPAVVSDENVISFEVEGRTNAFLATLDSRSVTLPKGVQMAIKKAPFMFRMIRLKHQNYMDTIRKKLMWGLDNRN
jgi:NAD+ kinase